MTDRQKTPSPKERPKEAEENKVELPEPPEKKESTPLRTRILALIGVALMIFLVIMYTYSMATGKIFAW